MYEVYSQCSRFQTCSVNQCPLDLMAPKRPPVPGDPEMTCKANLQERLDIISKYPKLEFPWNGLSKKEADSGRSNQDLINEDNQQHAKLVEKGKMLAKHSKESL